jgi:hypothetical protein
MRAKLKLKELKGTKVERVSLVTRAASRIPFRIMKSDQTGEPMNLLSIFKGEQPTAAAPADTTPTPSVLSAVIVQKGTDEEMTAIAEGLKGLGLSVEKQEPNEDGTVSFLQGDAVEGEVVRMSGSSLVVVKGFAPYAEAIESASFQEQVAAKGFYNDLNTACETLRSAVSSALYQGADQAAGVAAVEKALGEFGQYVAALAKGLPSVAFKADQAIEEVLKAAKAKAKATDGDGKDAENAAEDALECPEGVDAADWEKMTPEEKAKAVEDAAAAAKKDGFIPCPKGVSPLEWNKMSPEEKAAYKAPAKKEDEAIVAAPDFAAIVTEQLAPLAAAVAGLTETLASITKAQQELAETVKTATVKAEAAEKAVMGTVNALPAASDNPAIGVPVAKQDNDPRVGCFDTAFLPKRIGR